MHVALYDSIRERVLLLLEFVKALSCNNQDYLSSSKDLGKDKSK